MSDFFMEALFSSPSIRPAVIKISLEKRGDDETAHLGIRFTKEQGKIIVETIEPGGAGDASGEIRLGDELLQVNELHTEGLRLDELGHFIQAAEGKITLRFSTDGGGHPLCKGISTFVNAHLGLKQTDCGIRLLREEESSTSPGHAAAQKLLGEGKITQEQYVRLVAQDQIYCTSSMHSPAKEVQNAGNPWPTPSPRKTKAGAPAVSTLEHLIDDIQSGTGHHPLPPLSPVKAQATRWNNHSQKLWTEVYGIAPTNEFPGEPTRSHLNSYELESAIFKTKTALVAAATGILSCPTYTSSVALSGTATVCDELKLPENGFFTAGRKFSISVKHSNPLGLHDHDGGLEPRGVAIRFQDVMDVGKEAGEGGVVAAALHLTHEATDHSPPSEEAPIPLLDLVLQTGETSAHFNLDTFSAFQWVQMSGNDAKHQAWLNRHPSALTAAIGGHRRAPDSYTDLHYYSQTAYKFNATDGKTRYCKWRCVPFGGGNGSAVGMEASGLPSKADQARMAVEHIKSSGAPTAEVKQTPPSYLKEELTAKIAAGSVKWRLQMQVLEWLPTQDSYEIFNPSKTWDVLRCPFLDVMELELDSVMDRKEEACLEFDGFDISRVPDVLGIIPAWHSSDYNAVNVAKVEVDAALHAVQVLRTCVEPGKNEVPYVITLKNSGTCEKLRLRLHGTKGGTASVVVENSWRTHVNGSSARSFAVNAKYVGNIVGATIEKAPAPPLRVLTATSNIASFFDTATDDTHAGRATDDADDADDDDCYLEWVEVNSAHLQEPVRLTCCGWVKAGSPVVLFNAAAGTPEDDAEESCELREMSLQCMEKKWRWSKDKFDRMPLHAAQDTNMLNLPREQQLDEGKFVSFGLPALEGRLGPQYAGWASEAEVAFDHALNIDFKASANPVCHFAFGRQKPSMCEPLDRSGQFTAIADYCSPELFTTLECPERADRWNDDVEFADRFISGTNPICLERIYAIPAKLRVTNTMVQELMPHGKTLDDQLRLGAVYYIDHGPVLAETPMWDGWQGDGVNTSTRKRYAPPAQALFHVHPCAVNQRGKPRLMPLAIQLEVDKDAPVFTPSDDVWDWTVAKLFFMTADTQVHQFVSHHFSTRIAMEPFVISQLRHLAPCHPVSKLLHHHAHGMVAVNTLGRDVFIGKGGLADIALSCGGGGHRKMMSDFYNSGFDFNSRFVFPQFMKSRGLDDPTSLPNYHYRDDGMLLWDAIDKYVRTFLRLHYSSDDSVKSDYEVQNWVRGIHECGLRAAEGVPGPYFQSFDELNGLVTCFIFQVSCGHAAVNFSQWDSYAHALSRPGCSMVAPPRKKGACTEETVLGMMPETRMIRQLLETAHALSKFTAGTCFLGQFPELNAVFGREEERRVVAQFQDDLAVIDQQITARIDATLPEAALNALYAALSDRSQDKRYAGYMHALCELETEGSCDVLATMWERMDAEAALSAEEVAELRSVAAKGKLVASGDVYHYLRPSCVPNSVAI
jgi:arachidonate 5-lipoxygenase